MRVGLPSGAEAIIIGNLLLSELRSDRSSQLEDLIESFIARHEGAGCVVLNGNTFSSGSDIPSAIRAHERLFASLGEFASIPGRDFYVLPGSEDHRLAWDKPSSDALAGTGANIALGLSIEASTLGGRQMVRVLPGDQLNPCEMRGQASEMRLGASPTNLGATSPASTGATRTRPDPRGAHHRSDSADGSDSEPAGAPRRSRRPTARSEWIAGRDRLADPSDTASFTWSRLVYRRLARYLWLLFLPVLAVLLARISLVDTFISRKVARRLPVAKVGVKRILHLGPRSNWHPYVAIVLGSVLVGIVVLAVVLAVLARVIAALLGEAQGKRTPVQASTPSQDGGGGPSGSFTSVPQRRALHWLDTGHVGVITSTMAGPELSDLSSVQAPASTSVQPPGNSSFQSPGEVTSSANHALEANPAGPTPEGSEIAGVAATGFYADTGATTELTEKVRARLGMPPIYRRCVQASAVVIEAGSELRVRLHVAKVNPPDGTRLERSLATVRPRNDTILETEAAWPHGDTGSVADTASGRHTPTGQRRVRRIAAIAIALTGTLNLVSAAIPPLQYRLHLLIGFVPLVASQAAGALVAIIGLALLGLARGIRLGQRQAWFVAVAVLSSSVLLNLFHGIDLEESLVSLALLVFLVASRENFHTSSEPRSLGAALRLLVVGALVATLGVSGGLDAVRVILHRTSEHLPSFPTLLAAVAERLAGYQSIHLDQATNRFLAPALLAMGLGLVAIALWMATRPVRYRRHAWRSSELSHARSIVQRYGNGTLDYFALRDDKVRFYWRDTLVAYAVFNGVCLVSPDPIGPTSQRYEAWQAFRRHAHAHGWELAVLGASEAWLPTYELFGMHHLYLGDEAVVDTRYFSLEGNRNKGLRQAHSRIARHGYTISFHDPAHLSEELRERLRQVMTGTRRGSFERGFSMGLGRIFDPEDSGLLLAVASDPDGVPVAFCHYVPAADITGFSLDVMRHDGGTHPNGLLDFVLVETIYHLRDEGYRGLGLNFAMMRAVLDGTVGNSVPRRVERWFIRWISDSAQVESLWRFNAKYHPEWLPRYIVFDAVERFLPTALALLRAEAIWELPVVGRFLAHDGARTAEDLRSLEGDKIPR